jgi:hypothetical protein
MCLAVILLSTMYAMAKFLTALMLFAATPVVAGVMIRG